VTLDPAIARAKTLLETEAYGGTGSTRSNGATEENSLRLLGCRLVDAHVTFENDEDEGDIENRDVTRDEQAAERKQQRQSEIADEPENNKQDEASPTQFTGNSSQGKKHNKGGLSDPCGGSL
jgi:hypothetical protein